MHVEIQGIGALSQLEQADMEERPLAQIKGLPGIGLGVLSHAVLVMRHTRQINFFERQLLQRRGTIQDVLVRLAVYGENPRAQGFMARHERAEGLAESPSI